MFKMVLTLEASMTFVAFAYMIEQCRARKIGEALIGLVVLSLAALVLLLSLALTPARARDVGQWAKADPEIRAWYQSLMCPDVPSRSCCGEADAYWADEIHVRGGKTYVTITDDRDDAPLGRPHVPVGTEIEVPANKLKWDRQNPTGHGVLFLSTALYVWCYVQPGGV